MLIDVLRLVSVATGLDPVEQRATLLNLLNAGAKDMYDKLECNRIYREVTLSVQPNKLVSLPNYIGELRGMRTVTSEYNFSHYSMAMPRYVNMTWSYKWRNWRDLGDRAVQQYPALVAPLTIEATPEATPVILYVSGQTANAQRTEEQVTIDDSPLVTANSFGPEIYKIACVDDNRTSDITIKDANGNVLAKLMTDENRTRYKLVDVSQIPWPLDTTDGSTMVDVLFKVPFKRMSFDSDQFPAGDDYDNAWYFWALHRYYQPIQNKGPEAEQMMAQALLAMKSTKDSMEQTQEKRLVFGRNKFFDIFKKGRFYPGAITNVDRTIP